MADHKLSSLYEHGLNMAIPSLESEMFNVIAENIAHEIVEQAGSKDLKLMIMPTGGFAKALVKGFPNKSFEIAGYMDNFLWKSKKEIDGKPLIRPESANLGHFNKILLATPSYKVQREMKAQIVKYFGAGIEKDIFLFGDLFLESELRD